MGGMTIRPITADDDEAMGTIARDNLAAVGLDIPGTAFFDPEIMHLSGFYDEDPMHRRYYVAVDDVGRVLGGCGLAEFLPLDSAAELQKLYLADEAKGHGLGTRLVGLVEDAARELGYRSLYLETHSKLEAAIHLYEKLGYRGQSRARCDGPLLYQRPVAAGLVGSRAQLSASSELRRYADARVSWAPNRPIMLMRKHRKPESSRRHAGALAPY